VVTSEYPVGCGRVSGWWLDDSEAGIRRMAPGLRILLFIKPRGDAAVSPRPEKSCRRLARSRPAFGPGAPGGPERFSLLRRGDRPALWPIRCWWSVAEAVS